MNRKVLVVLGVLIVAAVALVLILTPKRDHYTTDEVAQLQDLVSKSDARVQQMTSSDTTVLRAFSNVFTRRGSVDSNMTVITRTMDARRPEYPVIHQQLDSIEHMLRDTASAFTKNLAHYVQSTRQTVNQLEQQIPMMAILHDASAQQMPPQQEAPTPVRNMPGGAALPDVAPPMAMPLIENIRIIEQLKPERQRAKAGVSTGYH